MRRTPRLLAVATLGCTLLLACIASADAQPFRPGRRPSPFPNFPPVIAPYISIDPGNLANQPPFPPSRATINVVPGPGIQPPGAPADPPPVTPVAPPNQAVVQVIVPDPAAEVSFGGYKTNSTGKARSFTSPDLTPGKTYHYAVKVTWRQDGRLLSEERKVDVTAGRVSVADFTRPPNGSLPPPSDD